MNLTPQLFKQANQHYQAANYKQAAELYLQLYIETPHFQPYMLNFALVLRRLGGVSLSTHYLQQAYEKHAQLSWQQAQTLIRVSGLFDPAWYAQHNSNWLPIGVDPVLHYVVVGWRLGLNPGPKFDTQAYVAQFYGASSRIKCPLLHYLSQKPKKPIQHTPLGHLRDQLWGGHSIAALIELEQIAADTEQPKEKRWWALWHQACWHYFSGNIAHALELALEMRPLFWGHRQRKEGIYLLYFCLCLLGRRDEAHAELGAYMRLYPQDTDALFAWSNSAANDDQRLQLINQAYALGGLVGLERKDSAQPLALNNIRGLPVLTISGTEKVSIIMPIYKAAEQVQIAIESLLAQSYSNLEIIAVDDCSPDQTFELLQALAQQDSRIKAVRMPKNSGAYAARNYGLALATGDFITTHDSDDWSHPQKIATQISYLQKHSEVMGCAVYWVRAESDLRFTQNWRPGGSLTHWSHSSFMFRKKVVQTLGSWDQVLIEGDTEYIGRMQAHFGTDSFAKIQQGLPLAFALDEKTSLTRTKATHVRTVYFGLRHIYRQIAAWWQCYQPNLKVGAEEVSRPFNAPKAMFSKENKPVNCHIVIAGDYSRLVDATQAALIIEQHPTQSIALFHWPRFGRAAHPLCNVYFELLRKAGVEPVVVGQAVSSSLYYLMDWDLLNSELDAYPEWIGFNGWGQFD